MAKKESPKINLVTNGVFPITVDQYGQPLDETLDTGLQFPGTIQGEGKLVGIPCLFVRTSGCNLSCAWRKENGDGEICDTPFSSWKPEKNLWEIKDLVTLIKNNIGDLKYVVVTGGEPLLQAENLTFLFEELKKMDLHITIETNGTLHDELLMNSVDLISMSPKLSNSIPWRENLRNTGYEFFEPRALRHQQARLKIKAIQKMIDACYHKRDSLGFDTPDYKNKKLDKDFQLKFVVSCETDIHEIKTDFLKPLKGIHPEDIILMPLGSNIESLNENTHFAMGEAIKNGWRYTPRLHVDMFNDKRSV